MPLYTLRNLFGVASCLVLVISSAQNNAVVSAESTLSGTKRASNTSQKSRGWIESHFIRIFPSQYTNRQQRNKARKRQNEAEAAAVKESKRSLANNNDDTDDDAYFNQNYYQQQNQVDDAVAANGDDAAAAADDAAVADDAVADDAVADDAVNQQADDAYNTKYDDDVVANAYNEDCALFLFKFLEGTTDARDTCEGILNAYTAADCSSDDAVYSYTHDIDDYFEEFAERQCCQALIAHHADYCEEDTLLSNFHLFVASAVLLLCEIAKAMVRKYEIHFLPEAATCTLVGTFVGLVSQFIMQRTGHNMNHASFDEELFLTLLLPPIIFEAALSVSKYEFKRRRGAIFTFSVFGTVISTFVTGLMVHWISKFSSEKTFPMLDSLVFGSLISSIDPVAILSVLTSLNLNQKDTIFILVFGESLLNDGIAITLFQTLAGRFDGKTNDGHTSADEVFDALATFFIAMVGSISIGLACGGGAWAYFFLLDKYLPPLMEVGSFFLWALIPYYIADGVGWSGIVSIVVIGFFMDIYIAGPKEVMATHSSEPTAQAMRTHPMLESPMASSNRSIGMTSPGDYKGMVDVEEETGGERSSTTSSAMTRADSFGGLGSNSIKPLDSTRRIHLSTTADRHVRFVAHLTSQLSENAIFAYLGLFLFSNKYDWNMTMVFISIVSCVVSRAFMVLVVSFILVRIYACRGRGSEAGKFSSRTAVAIQDIRTQTVLVLAGLRGAVSLALVENVPIYNNVTGEGCEFKQQMKAMTSAAILFTTFVFGGGAYYILPYLTKRRIPDTVNINPGGRLAPIVSGVAA